jgi:transposase
MNMLAEAQAILRSLPPQPEPERHAAEMHPEREVEQAVQLADTADVFPERDEGERSVEPTREELRRKAVRLDAQGLSRRQIAQATGLPLATVQRAIDKAKRRNGTDGTGREDVEQRSGDRPDWLPVNFKSGEALAEAYGHLQRKFHQVTAENAELREQLGEAVMQLAEYRRVLR